MQMYDIIANKRHGKALSDVEIRFFISGYVDGSIPDYQASALLMAICFVGMDKRELATLTDAMAHSGDTVDLSRFGLRSVDKHSTGGVGDKTSLVVAPLVACCGLTVAKMSGRGLGHTGGTVDKLESIKGYRTALSADEFLDMAGHHGIAVVGQSGNLTPADKKLYALRDVTATVDCVPLIASSIMSKKLAAGAHTIVLDVKCGSGAFLPDVTSAEELAERMVEIGRACGRQVSALITDMNAPLGCAVGNANEVREAVETLHGHGPADFVEVCLALATRMVALAKDIDEAKAREEVTAHLRDGRALAKFREWIAGQGGDPAYADDPTLFPEAKYSGVVRAPRDGFLVSMQTAEIGRSARLLGAGRAKKEDVIDMAAGILVDKKPGDAVKEGEVVARLFTDRPETLAEAGGVYAAALTYGDTAPAPRRMIYRVI